MNCNSTLDGYIQSKRDEGYEYLFKVKDTNDAGVIRIRKGEIIHEAEIPFMLLADEERLVMALQIAFNKLDEKYEHSMRCAKYYE